MRFGFIGAPIAAAISVNLGSLLFLLYGVFVAPRTAWYPFSHRAFTSLGVLVQLGLAGVGMTASEWWSWELVGRELPLTPCQTELNNYLYSGRQSVSYAVYAYSASPYDCLV